MEGREGEGPARVYIKILLAGISVALVLYQPGHSLAIPLSVAIAMYYRSKTHWRRQTTLIKLQYAMKITLIDVVTLPSTSSNNVG